MNTAPIVSKVWSFCTTLRDDGVSYGDYLEQLTYLIFLKMADEYAKPPYNRDVGIPAEYNWRSLKSKRGAELEAHYVTLLRELGVKTGMLGQIFTKAQNKIQDPAKLYRLIDMVDDTEWVTMDADVKGIYTKGCLRRTPRTPNRARASISRHARPHPRHGRMRAARTGQAHSGPGLRHRRLLSGGLRLHHQPGALHARPESRRRS